MTTLSNGAYPLVVSTAASYLPTDAILAVTGRFSVKAQDFMAHGAAYPTGCVGSAQSAGSNRFGAYQQTTLTLTYTSGGNGVVRIRTYDGKDAVEVFELTANATAGATRITLTYPSAQTKWFTTMRCMDWLHNDFRDWITTFPSEQSPMQSTSWPNQFQSFYGNIYASGQTCGIGAYLDPNSAAGTTNHQLFNNSWKYTASAAALSANVTHPSGTGFYLSTNVGYKGLYDYSDWQHRDTAPIAWPAWSAAPSKPDLPVYPVQTYTFPQIQAKIAALKTLDIPGFVQYEFDAKWQDNLSDDNINSTLAGTGFIAWTIAQGFKAGGYHTPEIFATSALYASLPDAAFVMNGGSRKAFSLGVYDATARYLLNPFTPEGKAAIEARAVKFIGHGFQHMRLDYMEWDVDLMYGYAKVFRDKALTIDPEFQIETHNGYMGTACNSLRTHDRTTFDWVNHAFVFKVGMCCTPRVWLNCDQWGHNHDWSSSTDAAGTPRNVANMMRQLRMMFGFGRPEWGASTEAQMTDKWVAARPTLAAINALPKTPPTYEIVGDWDTSYNTRQTYSDGTTISYAYATDSLTITAPAVLAFDATFTALVATPAILAFDATFTALVATPAILAFDATFTALVATPAILAFDATFTALVKSKRRKVHIVSEGVTAWR